MSTPTPDVPTPVSEPGSGPPALHRVWDAPTRLFHWTLVVLVLLQWGTAEWEWLSMDWHLRFGYAIGALLLFRLLWGFVGSQTARFSSFVRGPRAMLAYLRGGAGGYPGHNPLGALSVLAMLALLLAMVITGLGSSEPDEFLYAPFASWLGEDLSDDFTDLHEEIKNFVLVLIGLHLAAIAFYALRRRNLVGPMFTGRARLDADPKLRFAGVGRALFVFAVAVAVVWGVVVYAPD